MKNVKFSMRGAYDAGFTKHPQIVMRELGVDYCHAVPQSINESWDFWGCKGLPEELPEFLYEITAPPENFIGWGLSQEDVDKINEYSNDLNQVEQNNKETKE